MNPLKAPRTRRLQLPAAVAAAVVAVVVVEVILEAQTRGPGLVAMPPLETQMIRDRVTVAGGIRLIIVASGCREHLS